MSKDMTDLRTSSALFEDLFKPLPVAYPRAWRQRPGASFTSEGLLATIHCRPAEETSIC
jgi:hypothetical protein